jgi:hypothetical protein
MAAELDSQWRRVGEQVMEQQRVASRVLEATAGEIARQAGEQAAHSARLLQDSGELVRSRADTEARWIEQHGERMDQLAGVWRTELASLRQEESARARPPSTASASCRRPWRSTWPRWARRWRRPITRLLQTASEVPQAAAGVISQLRLEMSRVAERDNLALQERTVLLEQLGTLLQAVNQASGEQRAPSMPWWRRPPSVMEQAGARFAQALDAQPARPPTPPPTSAPARSNWPAWPRPSAPACSCSRPATTSSPRLQRIEASLVRSTARSDEQLAYYVAQAREVIDLSIASQQGLVENLRQLQGKAGKALVAEEAADDGAGRQRRRPEHVAPVWAVFGDLMSGLVGAFVLVLVGVLVVQMDLVASLQAEVQKRQVEEQRRMALEKALAIPLASGRVTLNDGRIGISGSVLFPVNSDQLRPKAGSCSRAWCIRCASTWASATRC